MQDRNIKIRSGYKMKFVVFYCEHHIIHGPGKVFAVCGRPRKHPNAIVTFTRLIMHSCSG